MWTLLIGIGSGVTVGLFVWEPWASGESSPVQTTAPVPTKALAECKIIETYTTDPSFQNLRAAYSAASGGGTLFTGEKARALVVG